MARSVDDWIQRLYDKPISTSIKLLTILMGVAFAFTVVVWGLRTNFSYWWGQGGAVQQRNSTANFIAAQAQFHRDLTLITADQQNMAHTRQQINAFDTAHPDFQGNGTPFDPLGQQIVALQTVLIGQQQGCQATVADYNTAAASFLTEDWRDADLPSVLDAATECGP